MSNKTIETKSLPPQAEPAPLNDEELDQVSGGMMSTRTGYKSNPGAMACCW